MAGQIASESGNNLMSYIAGMDNRLSDRSKRDYTARLKDISKQINHGSTLTPQMVIDHLRSLVVDNRIAYSTFRFNKSSIMYWLGQQAQAVIASGGDHSDYARAFDALHDLKYTQVVRSAPRTSSKKLKHFPEECAETLTKYAQEFGQRAPTAIIASAFVKANLLVGLRPVEWFDAYFASYFLRDASGQIARDAQGRIQFEHMLVVENAKTTHGRGNGLRRELVLHGVTSDELKALVSYWNIVREFKKRHPKGLTPEKLSNRLYRPINNVIRRVLLSKGYPSNAIPSSYSTRHQVIANFKASGVSRREIAAFFGHVSEDTHREHYGHKRHGSRPVQFRPSPESSAKVRQRGLVPEAMPHQLAADIDVWASEKSARRGLGAA